MFVYRLEDADGRGAFSSSILSECCETARRREGSPQDIGSEKPYYFWDKDPWRHPGPYDSRESDTFHATYEAWTTEERKAHFFGFTSMHKLVQWFDSEALRAEMVRDGRLMVSTYDVPSEAVLCGSYQCVFKREDHKPVERHPVPTLVEVTA